MANTNKLERDIKETRKQLSASLDELRYRARPQRVLGETAIGLRYSAAARFFRNLKADVVSNSVPLTLLAGAIGWLAIRPASRNQPTNENPYVAVFDWLSRMTSAASQSAARAGSAVQSGASTAQDRIGSLSRHTAQTAEAISQSAQSAAAAAHAAIGSTIGAARNTVESLQSAASSAGETLFTTAKGSGRAVERQCAFRCQRACCLLSPPHRGHLVAQASRKEEGHSGRPSDCERNAREKRGVLLSSSRLAESCLRVSFISRSSLFVFAIGTSPSFVTGPTFDGAMGSRASTADGVTPRVPRPSPSQSLNEPCRSVEPPSTTHRRRDRAQMGRDHLPAPPPNGRY
jgi:hypothetical protein